MHKLLRNLTFQVLIAILLGILLGTLFPDTAVSFKPVGELFINLIKMCIAPIIFLTIVIGIGSMDNMKKVGRVGGKALLYFEIVTTFALLIGLLVAHLIEPGKGVAVPVGAANKVSTYAAQAADMDWAAFFMHIIPVNVMDAFAKGDILQVLFFSVLFGLAIANMGTTGQSLVHTFEKLAKVFFKILAMVMRLAPLGALGGMAFTVGKFGVQTLLPLGKLMLTVYLTMFLFVFVVLQIICRYYRISLFNYLAFIREEILIVLGTSSSESVLPRMMEKMERYGCSKSVVSLVIPTGYSFNLDGTSIYLSIAVIFLAQAFGVDLSIGQQLTIIGILMVTSKGAAAVTGGGFIVLASTLSAIQVIPVEGLALLLGVDRFMSEARAITNLIGNGIATIVVAKSENEYGKIYETASEKA